jgi:hypothetical protein
MKSIFVFLFKQGRGDSTGGDYNSKKKKDTRSRNFVLFLSFSKKRKEEKVKGEGEWLPTRLQVLDRWMSSFLAEVELAGGRHHHLRQE